MTLAKSLPSYIGFACIYFANHLPVFRLQGTRRNALLLVRNVLSVCADAQSEMEG